ncbi:MAG TPA: 4-hydroxy-tetrahydrodipicolinate reductase, partial [Rhizobium sp.]|nr:4-hydroxy-tetrahydrodipicolinate reductase [Rhizobium sp.]
MKLVVVGASGRMGQAIIRIIAQTEGAVLHAAVGRPGSASIGKDAGELAGLGPLGVPVTDDALAAFVHADGVIDFTKPETSVEFSALAAQARIVHVIGTTGCSDADQVKFEAASRHARLVKSGNMSLGVNLLSVLVQQAAKALDAAGWDIEVLEMHHKHK